MHLSIVELFKRDGEINESILFRSQVVVPTIHKIRPKRHLPVHRMPPTRRIYSIQTHPFPSSNNPKDNSKRTPIPTKQQQQSAKPTPNTTIHPPKSQVKRQRRILKTKMNHTAPTETKRRKVNQPRAQQEGHG